jgi:hypothetical protein
MNCKRVWTELIFSRTETIVGSCECHDETLGFVSTE